MRQILNIVMHHMYDLANNVSLVSLLLNVLYNTAFQFSSNITIAESFIKAQGAFERIFILPKIPLNANVHQGACISWGFALYILLHEILNKSASSRSSISLHIALSTRKFVHAVFLLDSRCCRENISFFVCFLVISSPIDYISSMLT